MSKNKIYNDVDKYYSNKIKLFGARHKGLDWKSEESQFIRFHQLSKIIEIDNSSLNDIGCGLGDLTRYINNNFLNIKYTGYDISKVMINNATKLYPQNKFIHIKNFNKVKVADYSIASGIFNVKMKYSKKQWLAYILDTLKEMNLKSKKGFSFNLLSKYSDKHYMKENLFYASPLFFFDYCISKFSKNICLKHDYNLYEFTVLVRKNN